VSDGGDIFKAFTVTKGPPVFRHVYTSPPKEALQKFLKWLKDEVGTNVVLVNIFSTLLHYKFIKMKSAPMVFW
jgi:hypothetical protein